MSLLLISRSPDLQRLRDDGYDIEVTSGYLVVRAVPYVNAKAEVQRGTLATALNLAGDVTAKPATHVAYFEGEPPCHKDGSLIATIGRQSVREQIAESITANYLFSSKPLDGYQDYHQLVTTYVAILSNPAQAIDPTATAQTFPAIEATSDESVFQYIDTASSRAGIAAVTSKLELGKIAIVGLGGTGAYVLDLVAKTPVREIHLFDGDIFAQHNAFRAPGAASIEDLRGKLKKVDYFHQAYARMHRHIFPHSYYIDETNADELRGMDFVFLCLDRAGPRKLLVERLEEFDIPFVDTGMGLYEVEGFVSGVLRLTTSTQEQRAHVQANKRIPFSEGDGDNLYARNIQIADLNALSAALAVIKWKKLFGFYRDYDHEHHSTYTIDGNMITNEDRP